MGRKNMRRNVLSAGVALVLGASLFLSPATASCAYATQPSVDAFTGLPAIDQGALEDTMASGSVKHGWVVKGKHKYYYRYGMKLVGKQQIGKSYYLFGSDGRMKTGKVVSQGVTYYLSQNGKMEAYVKKGAYYKPTGKKMSSDEKKDYKAQLKARSIVDRLTTSRMTKSQKLRACYNWISKTSYHIYHRFKNVRGWSSDFANDHFVRKFQGKRCSDCNADAAALGYLALAIGYKDVRVHINKKNHGFTQIDGKFYDPYYAKRRGLSQYYGVRRGWSKKYTAKLLVPSASNNYTTVKYLGAKPKAKKSSSKVSAKKGLVKEKGSYVYYASNGKKLKSTWKTVGKHKYYFNKKGNAATGPVSIKGTYYVFSSTGKLQKGSGTRVVKVDGEKYRVSASGKAKPGWNDKDGKKVLYLRNGRKATGLSVYKDKLYWFDASGIYDLEKTRSIRAAAVPSQDASELIALIGDPLRRQSSPSCFPLVEETGGGDDVTYLFKNAKVVLFRAPDGRMFYESCDYNA